MWLWILSALFLALVWGVWFILRPTGPGPSAEVFPTWIPIAITAVVVLGLVGLVVYRRIRAARAARALEKAIAQQAQEQALNAKPERRAEIQELHRQLQEGINALKSSKLGGGTNALYSLPWYVMVGPPGAGKTTALRHSGLVFPYLDPAGGGVRGVGGTRNCDWWFTNEAILLDTAGRYTTEADDHDEWMAFLEQLLKYRPDKPVNGVVCAVSISELVDATEEQVESIAKKVRARIDEMQSTLKMVLPVYVMFTKVDLVSGFVEFFGDLKKSERGQGFGATVKLDANKSEPGKIFDAEFDTLVERMHDRALRRMVTERNRGTKEKVFQFPLEFAAIKGNLSHFLNVAFQPSKTAGLATPIMRGFYMTSGVQEGKPLERVLGTMMSAFGLRPAIADESSTAGTTEAKSYFLRDVFMNVIFPDQDIAARTAAEVRKRRFQRFAAAFAAAALAVVLLIPSVMSFANNRALVAETSRISGEAAGVKWTDGSSPLEKVEKLDNLRSHAQLLDQYREEGAPVSYRWGMYQGDKLFEPTKDQYIASLREGFVKPVRARLEERLNAATGGKYLEEYNDLKTYLLLADEHRTHLLPESETAWETGKLLQLWTDILRPTTDIPEADLKAKLAPHVKYYVDLLRRGAIRGEELDKRTVERTRDILARVGPTQRYYDRFVTALIDEKYDENGPNTRENLKYPPLSLDDLFSDRPEVLSKVRSAQKERTSKWFVVRGPYTAKGHAQVVASLEEGIKVLDRERWVVPLTQEEERQGDKIAQALARVRQDYDAQYIREWLEFFRDILVEIPPNNKEAIEEFRVLSTPDWPYQRLLRALEDNTQFDVVENQAEQQVLNDGGVLDQVKERVKRRIDSSFSTRTGTSGRLSQLVNFGGGAAPGIYDPIPDKFRSMVRFGVPEQPKQTAEGVAPPPPTPAELSKYIGHLEQLAAEMGGIEDAPPGASTQGAREKFGEAVRETEKLLLKMDETGQELMTPLLMNPLRQAYKAVMRSAGGSASGLWEVVVWPPFRENIKDRYPFDLAASRDASFEDVVAFLKPKEGILWGFYEQHLNDFHIRVGHDFIPKGGLEGRPKPAKPFTPFNAMLYPCLHRAHEITEAMWPSGGGDKPQVTFHVNLKTVSPIVSEVLFEIDGQKRQYRNEKEFWHTFTWPGEKQTGARLRVRGAGGLDEELVREGPWGIFRLFEAGTTTAEKDKDSVFTVTWQMTAPPVTVTMEVRPTRANHPFVNSFFRATNCPPSIGDSFGGKKGS
ncbi:type VI secretion system membrane subunit TssM [Polyangium mundeleinium]|uniref:Type VI secretion system membrane subunit TssM n=1 Tax=Polyangium mundeleinium TaxID=2995306 RepID=A0ABT5EWW0_9BACT|nr:type VI secretion system membrane subunit TssM [Polyangium mundeleinium]MDC0746303.1 type VI secretion system membrane subunit TssM [Polyangium mundeleinium]